jgi:hypothetical protein
VVAVMVEIQVVTEQTLLDLVVVVEVYQAVELLAVKAVMA